MAEKITEADARAECRRCGLDPDDWRQDHGQERVYVWQDVQRQMIAEALANPNSKET